MVKSNNLQTHSVHQPETSSAMLDYIGGGHVVAHKNNKDLKSVASSLKQDSTEQQLLDLKSGGGAFGGPRGSGVDTPQTRKKRGTLDHQEGKKAHSMLGIDNKMSGAYVSRRMDLGKQSSSHQDGKQKSNPTSAAFLDPDRLLGLRIDGDRVQEANQINCFSQNLQGVGTGNRNRTAVPQSRSALLNPRLDPSSKSSKGGYKIDSSSQTPNFEDPYMSPKSGSALGECTGMSLSNIQGQQVPPLHVVQESNRTIISGTTEGEVIPTIAVSRRYMNAISREDDNIVVVEHSYSSSIKNPRNHRHSTSISSQQQQQLMHQNLLDNQSYHHRNSTIEREVRPEDHPKATHPLLPKAGGQGEQMVYQVIYVRDGDWTYEISGRDLVYFKRMKQKKEEEADQKKRLSKLSGIHKQHQLKKALGHMNPNIRPCTAGAILKKYNMKAKEREDTRCLLGTFFEMLKAQGKARIIRDEENEPPQVVFNRDVIYSSSIANSMLKPSVNTETQLHQTMNDSPNVDDNQQLYIIPHSNASTIIPSRSRKEICTVASNENAPQVKQNSPKTVYRRVSHTAAQMQLTTCQQSSDDFKMMIGNPTEGVPGGPLSISEIQSLRHHNSSQKPPQGIQSLKGGSGVGTHRTHDTMRNTIMVGGTTVIGEKSASGILAQGGNQVNQQRKGYSFRQHEMTIFRSDERPARTLHLLDGMTKYQEKFLAVPGGGSLGLNIPAIRRLVNFKQQKSGGGGLAGGMGRQHNYQQSSNVDSSKPQLMQPLLQLNDDLFNETGRLIGMEMEMPTGRERAQTEELKEEEVEMIAPKSFTDNQSQNDIQSLTPHDAPHKNRLVEDGVRNHLLTDGQAVEMQVQTNVTYPRDQFSVTSKGAWKSRKASLLEGTSQSAALQNSVRMKEFKIHIQSPPDQVSKQALSSKGGEDSTKNSGQLKGTNILPFHKRQTQTKFSNTQIKKYFQSVASSSNQKASDYQSPSAVEKRKSPKKLKSKIFAKSAGRVQIPQGVALSSLVADDLAGILPKQDKRQRMHDPEMSINQAQPGVVDLNLVRQFYDTPIFGGIGEQGSYDIPHQVFTPVGFATANPQQNHQHLEDRLDTVLQSSTEYQQNQIYNTSPSQDDAGPDSSKKNVLISKKPMTQNQASVSPKKEIESPVGQHLSESAQAAEGPAGDGVPEGNEALLEHIIEETCESIDSMGNLARSTHTMKSNFNDQDVMQALPQPQKAKRAQANIVKSKQPQGREEDQQKAALMAAAGAIYVPLTERNKVFQQNSGVSGENELSPPIHGRVVHSKRSISPMDVQRMQILKQNSQGSNTLALQPNIMGGSRLDAVHPSARSLHSENRSNRNADYMINENNNPADQKAAIDQYNGMQKLNLGGTSSLPIEIPAVLLPGRGPRQGGMNQDISGAEFTKGSFPPLSQFEALPRYDNDSLISLRQDLSLRRTNGQAAVHIVHPQAYQRGTSQQQKENDSLRINMNLNQMSQGKKQRIEMPQVEPMSNASTPMTTFGMNKKIIISQSHQVEQAAYHEGVTKGESVGGFTQLTSAVYSTLNQRPSLDQKQGNLVHNLRGIQPQKDNQQKQAATSTMPQTLKGRAKTAKQANNYQAIGTVMEIVADTPKDMMTIELEKTSSRIRGNTQYNELEKLDPKQSQMLKRNIHVHRKANQKLRDIKSGRALLNKGKDLKGLAGQNPSTIIAGGSSLMESDLNQQMIYDQYCNSQVPHQATAYYFQRGADPNHPHKSSIEESLSVGGGNLKNEDSSTVKDESILIPQIYSHNQKIGVGNQEKANQQALNQQSQGVQQVRKVATAELVPRRQIQVPRTAVNLSPQLRQNSVQGIKKQGSNLTTDRMGHYVAMMSQNLSGIDILNRSSVEIINSVSGGGLNQSFHHQSGLSPNQFKPLIANTIQGISTTLQNQQFLQANQYAGKHRRIKSSVGQHGFGGGFNAGFGGGAAAHQGVNSTISTAFGRCTTAVGSSTITSAKRLTGEYSFNGMGSAKEVRQTIDYSNRSSQLSGLLIAQNIKPIMPSHTAGGGASPSKERFPKKIRPVTTVNRATAQLNY